MSDELTFDQAGAAAQAPVCTVCRSTIADRYWLAGAQVVCGTCRSKLERELAGRAAGGGLLKALLFGLGGAAAGALVYYAVLAATGYEVGLIAILVGWLVGRAVFIGSGRRGGRLYQVAAIVLTYFAIVSTYIPLMFKAAREQGLAADSSVVAPLDSAAAVAPLDSAAGASADSTAASADVSLGRFVLAWLAILGLAAALPVLAGIQNIIGIAIIAFALYQAWKMAALVTIAITGPFAVGPSSGAAPATG